MKATNANKQPVDVCKMATFIEGVLKLQVNNVIASCQPTFEPPDGPKEDPDSPILGFSGFCSIYCL